MRKWGAFLAAAALAACTDAAPTGESNDPSFGLVNRKIVQHHDLALTNAIEVPACPSQSKGTGIVNVFDNGLIEAGTIISNRGNESIRFGHIHHLNPGSQTGPIIWWVTSPVGVDLNATDRYLSVRQIGTFVANAHFASHDAGLAELLARPQDFYLNFHSDNCPGGFARAFLQAQTQNTN
jgi:hypothetical protein